MSETNFIEGLIVKAPHRNAPEYVKAKLSIKRADLIAWLQSQDGDWINADIKESHGGKWYAAVDNWKPDSKRDSSPAKPAKREQSAPASAADDPDDDIPF